MTYNYNSSFFAPLVLRRNPHPHLAYPHLVYLVPKPLSFYKTISARSNTSCKRISWRILLHKEILESKSATCCQGCEKQGFTHTTRNSKVPALSLTLIVPRETLLSYCFFLRLTLFLSGKAGPGSGSAAPVESKQHNAVGPGFQSPFPAYWGKKGGRGNTSPVVEQCCRCL